MRWSYLSGPPALMHFIGYYTLQRAATCPNHGTAGTKSDAVYVEPLSRMVTERPSLLSSTHSLQFLGEAGGGIHTNPSSECRATDRGSVVTPSPSRAEVSGSEIL